MKDLYFFKGRNKKLLSVLTLNDATFWGADVFVAVVFALFITQHIDGGTATHVGIVYGVYRIVRALLALPIGAFFDRHVGYIDEMWGMISSSLLTGSMYFVLFSVTHLWAVYVCIIFIAIGHAINIGSWKILFYGSIDKQQQGHAIGMYETAMQIVYGIASILTGIVGDVFGFEWIMILAGIATVFSGALPFFVRKQLNQLQTNTK